jgi:hypothetical protein
MIWAAILRVSVERSINARCTTGMIRANDGASMKCTNCVSNRVCKHVAVLFDGSCSASNRTGTIARKHNHTELHQTFQYNL